MRVGSCLSEFAVFSERRSSFSSMKEARSLTVRWMMLSSPPMLRIVTKAFMDLRRKPTVRGMMIVPSFRAVF